MDRTFVPRLGRLPVPAGARRGSRRRGRVTPSRARALVELGWRRRRLRLGLLALLVVLPLLGGGWLLLRDWSLVAVERVQISGVRGVDAAGIESALSGAARHMTTLDVKVGALRAAVAPFRVVRDLRVSTSFPHGLRIHVIEQLPVAAVVVGGVRTAVAADGAVLGPGLLSSSLPTIHANSEPLLSGRVRGEALLAELSVLGAAPSTLAGWVTRAFTGPEGLTVTMRNGLAIYFGDASHPHAKWLSAARVLADPSSAGATYVDVRLPERPAAGSTAASGLEGATTPAQVSASDPSAAALAATLAEAVTGKPSGASSASSAQEPPVAAQSSSPSTTQSAPEEASTSTSG
jgi:cell division protein FtsQ